MGWVDHPTGTRGELQQAEWHLQLEHGLLWILAHIWDGRPRHEVEQRQDEGGALAQDVVGFAAVGAEVAVVGAVATPHGLHHGGAQLHWGRERLGVTAWRGAEY